MKVLALLFALFSLAAAQFGLEQDLIRQQLYNQIGRRPWTSSIYNQGIYGQKWGNRWGGLYGNQGLFDIDDELVQKLYTGSYGPFSRVGGLTVPNSLYHQDGLYGNQYDTLYKPYGRVGGLYTPFSPFSTLDSVVSPLSIYQRDPLKVIENSVSPFNPVGDNVSPLSRISQMHHISPLSEIPRTHFDSLDITPFSKNAMFNMLTKGNNWDVYAKTIFGRNKGLGRKLREVCPEIDGGLSYESCVTEAHTRGFQCLKDVEDHPRYQVCTHKPIVKKFLREFLVTDMEHQKELLSCLSTTTKYDEINLKRGVIDGSRLGPDDDLSDEVANKEIERPHLKLGRFGYNVEVSANTRQCFYKLRAKVQECSEMAKQCPKFRQCYEHPTIKTLKAQKHISQAKYVKIMDMCLQGTRVPETGIFDDVIGTTGIRDEIIPGVKDIQDIIYQGDRFVQDLAF